MTEILIIGAGKIGQVVAGFLAVNTAASVSLWDKDATKVPNQGDLLGLAGRADVIFLCVHSWIHRGVLEELRSHYKNGGIIVSLAKGIEKESGKTMNEVLADYLSPECYGLLSGPMLADEIAAGKISAAVIGSKSPDVCARVSQLFADSKLLIQYSDDTVGVSLCGVLKNIYAIALGACDGLALGCNARGVLIEQILFEMSSIVEAQGGNRETVYSFAGVADLAATGLSPNSNNYTFGKELAVMGGSERPCEGCISLPTLISVLSGAPAYPLLKTLEHIIIHAMPVHEAFTKFFKEKKEREALSHS